MDSFTLHQVLVALTWLLLMLLMSLLWLLARFFERLSARRTYYRWLLVPMALFTAAAFQGVVAPGESPITYSTAFVGGLWLSAFCLSLYRKMTVR